jgi:hypothetical protein
MATTSDNILGNLPWAIRLPLRALIVLTAFLVIAVIAGGTLWALWFACTWIWNTVLLKTVITWILGIALVWAGLVWLGDKFEREW